MATTQSSLTPFERLVLAFVQRQLSDKDFQMLCAAMADEPFLLKLRTDQSRQAQET